jgi:hypothetical protein
MVTREHCLLEQSGDRLTIEHRLRVNCPASVKVTERPTEQSAIESFGGDEIRRHQLDEDCLADVMLLAGWLNDGGKLELRGGGRCRDRDGERCGKQPPPKKIANSIGWIHPYLRAIFLGTEQPGKHELLEWRIRYPFRAIR